MRVLRFFDRQRALALQRPLLRRLARCLLEEQFGRRDYELGIHFIEAAEMAGLNQSFLAHQGSTDVLTFNHQENALSQKLCGEIFICVDDTLVHARRFRVRWPWELTRYLVHGLLHLQGCDDAEPRARRAMKRRENKLLKELSARFALGKMGRQCR